MLLFNRRVINPPCCCGVINLFSKEVACGDFAFENSLSPIIPRFCGISSVLFLLLQARRTRRNILRHKLYLDQSIWGLPLISPSGSASGSKASSGGIASSSGSAHYASSYSQPGIFISHSTQCSSLWSRFKQPLVSCK